MHSSWAEIDGTHWEGVLSRVGMHAGLKVGMSSHVAGKTQHAGWGESRRSRAESIC